MIEIPLSLWIMITGGLLVITYSAGMAVGINRGRKDKREELRHGLAHILGFEDSEVIPYEDGSCRVSFTLPPEEELLKR